MKVEEKVKTIKVKLFYWFFIDLTLVEITEMLIKIHLKQLLGYDMLILSSTVNALLNSFSRDYDYILK